MNEKNTQSQGFLININEEWNKEEATKKNYFYVFLVHFFVIHIHSQTKSLDRVGIKETITVCHHDIHIRAYRR